MTENPFLFISIPLVVLSLFFMIQKIRQSIYAPDYEKGFQKPGKLERVILSIVTGLTGLLFLLSVAGMFMQEQEMALVCGVIGLLFLGIGFLLKRGQAVSYKETSDYFTLRSGQKEETVYYENIVDWQAAFNEIKILDRTKEDGSYTRVNFKLFKPETLLRKIAELAFEGRFRGSDQATPEDPERKAETIHYITNNQYGYLVEDYMEQISQKS